MSALKQYIGPRSVFAILLSFSIVGFVIGAAEFYFYADDAFITFRYASNALAGHGFVWNPPPFHPVEGYTSFGWLVLLTALWKITGAAPPVFANYLALFFGLLGFVRFAYFAWNRPWMAASGLATRALTFGCVLLLAITNTTYLTWLSSGLETALFNALVISWIAEVFERRPRRWVLCVLAALLPLVRPEGAVFLATTFALETLAPRRAVTPARLAALGAMVAPTAALFLWRHDFYGAWLPNTYYAKHLGPWPEAGWRYLASFVLEFALYVPLLGGLLCLTRSEVRRSLVRALVPTFDDSLQIRRLAGIGTALFVLGYYTFSVGGDHFEYRIYSWTPPFIGLLAVYVFFRLAPRPAAALTLSLSFLFTSMTVSWACVVAYDDLHARGLAREFRSTERVLPGALAPVAAPFDDLQRWLIEHFICIRKREHEVLWRESTSHLPPREIAARYGRDRRMIAKLGVVGIPGWTFPNVAFIDVLGLNDAVVARNPYDPSVDGVRKLAHSRKPPPRYIECLRPNFRFQPGVGPIIDPTPPVSDDEIRRCEQRFLDELGFPAPGPTGAAAR